MVTNKALVLIIVLLLHVAGRSYFYLLYSDIKNLCYIFLACQVQLSCYSGQAVFLCTTEEPILSWKIRAEGNVQKYISFHMVEAIGTQRTSAIAGTTVRAEKVASSSSSTVSSMIVLVLPIDPDLLSVECNRKILLLDYLNMCKIV